MKKQKTRGFLLVDCKNIEGGGGKTAVSRDTLDYMDTFLLSSFPSLQP